MQLLAILSAHLGFMVTKLGKKPQEVRVLFAATGEYTGSERPGIE